MQRHTLFFLRYEAKRRFIDLEDFQVVRLLIPHYFSEANCPKINTFIERYNRTLLEPLFMRRLSEEMVFYNTERPYKSLGLKSPLEYLVEKGGMSKMHVTYTPLRFLLYFKQ